MENAIKMFRLKAKHKIMPEDTFIKHFVDRMEGKDTGTFPKSMAELLAYVCLQSSDKTPVGELHTKMNVCVELGVKKEYLHKKLDKIPLVDVEGLTQTYSNILAGIPSDSLASAGRQLVESLPAETTQAMIVFASDADKQVWPYIPAKRLIQIFTCYHESIHRVYLEKQQAEEKARAPSEIFFTESRQENPNASEWRRPGTSGYCKCGLPDHPHDADTHYTGCWVCGQFGDHVPGCSRWKRKAPIMPNELSKPRDNSKE
jgi:hypothetical protein